MEGPIKGEVVILEFPFSDLISYKRRPSLIIKVPKGNDVIICQITSEQQEKSVEIPLSEIDFENGKLKRKSYIRIDKITTIKKTRIKYKVGSLNKEKFDEVLETICNFLKTN